MCVGIHVDMPSATPKILVTLREEYDQHHAKQACTLHHLEFKRREKMN